MAHARANGGTAPLIAARFVAAGITFAIPLVLARAMNLEEYGTYKQLFLVTATLHAILPLGMAQSLYFFVPRASEPRAYLLQTYLFMLGVATLGAIGLIAFAGPLSQLVSNPGLYDYRWLMGAYLVGLMGSYPLELSLTTRGKTRESARVYLVSDALRALAMVVPVLLGYGLRGAMHAIVAFTALRLLVAWGTVLWGARRSEPARRERKRGALFAEQLRYALPFGAAMVLNLPQQYAHQYAVAATFAPELFAIYAVGCFQLPLVDLLYTPTSEVLMVRLGQLDKAGRIEEGAKAFAEATARLAYVFFPLCAFFQVGALEFVGTLFGEKFLAAAPILQLSALSIALSAFPIDGVLRARNQTRHLFVSYAVKAVVTVPLLWAGLRWFGMTGAIVSWALAELIGKATLFARIPAALSSERMRHTARSILPARALATAAGAAIAAALIVWVLRVGMPWLFQPVVAGSLGRLLPLALIAAVFGVAYVLALRLLGVNATAVIWAEIRRRLPNVGARTAHGGGTT